MGTIIKIRLELLKTETMNQLQNRRERVSRLLSLAMHDRNSLKVRQATYLLEQINQRILRNSLLENYYSNL